MKKITSCILLIYLLLCTVTISVYADNRDLTVFIASGSSSAYRYHARANCSSLSRSVVAELTLEEAAQRGFTACSRCHPPEPDFEVTVTPRPITEGSGGTYTRSSTERPEGPWRTPWFYLYLAFMFFLLFGLPFLLDIRKRKRQEALIKVHIQEERKRLEEAKRKTDQDRLTSARK